MEQQMPFSNEAPFEQQVAVLFAQDEQPELLNAKAPMKKPREQAKMMRLAMNVFVESFIILSPVINS